MKVQGAVEVLCPDPMKDVSIGPRTGVCTFAYTSSHGRAVSRHEGVGETSSATSVEDGDDLLSGANRYWLSLPKSIPASLFWSVTVYDPVSGPARDKGQLFPSINTMDKPATNTDGSIDIYFGPRSPGEGRNWLRTLPDRRFFVILRLYGPTRAFYDQTWNPGDLEKLD